MPPLLVLVPQKSSLAATDGARKVYIVFSVVVVDDPIPYPQQEQHSCLFGGHPFYFLRAPFL